MVTPQTCPGGEKAVWLSADFSTLGKARTSYPSPCNASLLSLPSTGLPQKWHPRPTLGSPVPLGKCPRLCKNKSFSLLSPLQYPFHDIMMAAFGGSDNIPLTRRRLIYHGVDDSSIIDSLLQALLTCFLFLLPLSTPLSLAILKPGLGQGRGY